MKNWLRFEWIRLRQSRSFWGLVLSFLALLGLLSFTLTQVFLSESGILGQLQSMADARLLRQVYYWLFLYLDFTLIFFIVKRISEEHQFGTLKQHIIEGVSREQVFFVRLLFVFGLTALAHLSLYLVSSFVVLKLGFGFFEGTSAHWILAGVFHTIGILSFATLVTTYRPRSISVLVFIVAWVSVLEPAFGLLIELMWGYSISNYLPMASFASAAPEFQMFSMPEPSHSSQDLWKSMFFPLLYFALFWYAIYYKLKNTDL
jgi:hypothetical protein